MAGRANDQITVANLTSVAYVETTVGQSVALSASGAQAPANTAQRKQWVFEALGDFHRVGLGSRAGAMGPVMHVLLVFATEQGQVQADLRDKPLDLALLGPPVIIPRGQLPSVDDRRAPGANGPLGPTGDTMALDADPSTPGVIDATRSITGTAQFSLGINVTADADPYKGYQWEIEYPTAGLAFDGSVVENTSGTGLGVCTNSAANPSITPVNAGDTVYGNGAGCLTTSQTFQSSYVGQTTTFHMHCLTPGTYSVLLLDFGQDPGFGTTLIATGGTTLSTATTGITITCQ